MPSIKELAGKFEVKNSHEFEINMMKVRVPIKSLPVNFDEQLDEILPYPEPPKKPNRKTHTFEFDYNDPKYLTTKSKVDKLRIYATVILAMDGPLQVAEMKETKKNGEKVYSEFKTFEFTSKDTLDQIDELIETKIPIGHWADLANKVQEASGIKEEDFR